MVYNLPLYTTCFSNQPRSSSWASLSQSVWAGMVSSTPAAVAASVKKAIDIGGFQVRGQNQVITVDTGLTVPPHLRLHGADASRE